METSVPQKEAKRLLTPKEVLIGVIIAIIFSALYFVTLTGYVREGRASAAPYLFGDEKQTDRVEADARVLSIDPVKGEMSVRVDLIPQGSYEANGGYASSQNLTVLVNSATGQAERTYEKGKAVNPFDVTISLDGLVNDYPFDKYNSSLFLYITSKADKEAEEVEVPVLLYLTANIPGYNITAEPNKDSADTAPYIDMAVKRSSTVTNVALAGMIIMWAIGVAVIFLTLAFVVRSRKAEAFAFYSGLLFGLFGLRNSLPGTPPIGTQSDYLAFFWVEAIVAVMMVLTILVSLLRPQK